jgi:hypothetical protein
MPDLNGFDYAYANPDPAQMRAAGVEIVGRYLWNGGKGITLTERQQLHAGGLGVFHYYEAGRGYLLTDPATVRGYGVQAVNIALGLGAPAGAPIVHSIDLDITTNAQLSTLGRSFEQLQQARGRYTIAGYGEADAVDWLYSRGLISEFVVQTVAWSGGRVSPHAAVLQYKIEQNFHGQAVDYLTILNRPAVERAVWWPPGHNPPTEDDMYTDADRDLMHRIGDLLHANTDGLGDKIVNAISGPDGVTLTRLGQVLHSNTDTLAAKQDQLITDVKRIVAAGGDPQVVAEAVVARIGQVLQGAS